jgi:hypothetical protein
MPGVVWTPVAETELDEIRFDVSLVDRRPPTGERIHFEIRDRSRNTPPSNPCLFGK